jgi:predicted  nucleic acid-binding Zn-ribbon protein
MTDWVKSGSENGWICNRCKVPLVVQKVRLQYLRVIFALDLPACPQCGMILIAEELAIGKVAEAEQALEDK